MPQKPREKKPTKKLSRRSTLGKFKVCTKKTQETSGTGGTTRRRRKHRAKLRTTDPYKTRNQELKMEESKRAKKSSTEKEDDTKN